MNCLQMELENDDVLKGKLLAEKVFQRKNKEIAINDELEKIGIKIDVFDKKKKIIKEVKKSKKFQENHKWQLLYYLYILKNKGINNITGLLSYPNSKKNIIIKLTKNNEKQLINIIDEIQKMALNKIIQFKQKKSFCNKCSYNELCNS